MKYKLATITFPTLYTTALLDPQCYDCHEYFILVLCYINLIHINLTWIGIKLVLYRLCSLLKWIRSSSCYEPNQFANWFA